jgi:protein MpaA
VRIRRAAASLLAAGLLGILVLPGPTSALEVRTIGTSVRGKPILAYRIGDPTSPNTALVVGAIHGDEPAGIKIAERLRNQYAAIGGVDLWVVDTINPYGVAAGRRTNAHKVDLNRNWDYRWRSGARDGYYPGPSPFSEPETRAMRDFISEIQPETSIWFHQPWNAVLRPCSGPAELQHRYAKVAHMKTSCRGNDLRGTAITWQNATFPGTQAIVVELPGGKIRQPSVRRNARAVAAVIAP